MTICRERGNIFKQSASRSFTSEISGLRKQYGMRGWRNWQTRTFEVRVVYPWGFESPPSHKRKTHGLAIDRGFFLCFPTKAANKTAGPDSIQGPAVLCMQEKGLEPSLTGNWCLKPARLPFRHSCTENLFSLSIFAGNVNSSACFCILQIFSRSYPIRDTADPM